MPSNVPVTVWRTTDGNNEMGQSNDANITTLSGVLLTTLAGNQLIVDAGTATQIPATKWTEDDSL